MSMSLRFAIAAPCLFFAALCHAADGSSSGADVKAMDKTVNPCANFYQYACGNWRANNPIPPDQSRWARFNELHERNLQIAHEILEKAAIPNPNRTPVEQKIGDYYAACMDEQSAEKRGVLPIAPLIKSIRAISKPSDLTGEAARLFQNGVHAMFSFNVAPDKKNSNEEIAQATQGGLGLPDREYYLRTDPKSVELREQYKKHVQTMLELFSRAEGRPNTGAGSQAEAILRLETALAKGSLDRVSMRIPANTYHKMPVGELQSLTPAFAWNRFFSDIGLPPIQTLNVAEPDFFKAVQNLIENTDLADWKAYLTWHVLDSNAALLTRAIDEERFRFDDHILLGAKEEPARWKRCVDYTDRGLGEALGQKFVEVAFSPASKEKALQLVGQIESEMEKDIKDAAWMTPATKDQALTKLTQVTNKIGYPEKWRDYSSVKIERGDFYDDVVRARQFEIRRNLQRLGKPVDKSEWSMTPPTVNAYYSPPMNNINFPAGILQPPFYNPKAGDAVNYGAIGVVIGHELTHGFDDQGRRYDGAGNLRDWWTADDAKAFESRADCVVKEYGGFSPAPGVNLNGKLTLGENAADNGGIRLAYMALMDSLAKHVLPTNDGLTPRQQFFLGYAQVWCENSTEQVRRLRATTDPHSPGEFRVNGVVQNMPEFGEAFSCKLGDPMVSSNPCRVW